jgi:hypothetical protein
MFSDHSNDGSGARQALRLATAELKKRIAKLDAPSGLRRGIGSNKSSNLPVGISGPIVRQRAGRNTRDASFGVSLPRFGQKPTTRNVYIAIFIEQVFVGVHRLHQTDKQGVRIEFDLALDDAFDVHQAIGEQGRFDFCRGRQL